MPCLRLVSPVAAIVALSFGCDSKPNAGTEAQLVGTAGIFEPGQLAQGAHYSLVVHTSKRCAVEPHFQPPAGVLTLGLEITLKGRSAAEVPVNPFYATLTDSEGQRYEATLVGCTPQLKATRVTQGASARGWITFNVPESSHGLRFTYAPIIIGAGRQELVFLVDP